MELHCVSSFLGSCVCARLQPPARGLFGGGGSTFALCGYTRVPGWLVTLLSLSFLPLSVGENPAHDKQYMMRMHEDSEDR
jgi:hypothetical protein